METADGEDNLEGRSSCYGGQIRQAPLVDVPNKLA